MNKQTNLTQLFEGLLKSPLNLIEQIRENKTPGTVIGKLLIISLLGFLIFGVSLGSFSFHEQLWAAPLKILLGITLSTLICLPSLYIFSALTGTTLGIKDIAQGISGTLALIASLLLGFTPVLWVFSQSTSSETLFGFIVLTTWLIAFFFGTGFLLKMIKQTGATKTAPLKIWIGIFLLVTLQMSTTLRPLIGRSEKFLPISLTDTSDTFEKRSFLKHWGMTFNKLTESNHETIEAPRHPKYEKPAKTPSNSKSNPFLDE